MLPGDLNRLIDVYKLALPVMPDHLSVFGELQRAPLRAFLECLAEAERVRHEEQCM